MYDSAIQLYANGNDTNGNDVCLVTPDRIQHQWWCQRHDAEYSERHTKQYDGECSDSSIQCDTEFRHMHRLSVYGKRSGQPGLDDIVTDGEYLQRSIIELYTNGDHTCRDDVCVEPPYG